MILMVMLALKPHYLGPWTLRACLLRKGVWLEVLGAVIVWELFWAIAA